MTIPKGFFPTQDTGLIIGVSEARRTSPSPQMVQRQLALGRIVAADPDVATVGMTIGASVRADA